MPTFKNILKRAAAEAIFRPYYGLRTAWPVWFYLLNAEGRRLYRKDAAPASPAAQRLAGDLRQYGIAVTSIDELFPGQDLLPVLSAYAALLRPHAETREGKPFLRMLWKDDMAISTANPFIRLALAESVLAVVNGYLGMYGKFYYSSLDITLPVRSGADPIRSQGWHRDPEDKKMCKMFIYLSDVDGGAGPFMYVPGSQYGGPLGDFYPQQPPKGSYLPPGAMEKKVPADGIKVCTGRKGTVIFADTAGLHKGGYATSGERLMFTADYSSKASLRPIRYRYGDGFKKEGAGLGLAGRYAAHNDFGLLKYINKVTALSLKYGIYL